MASKRLYDLAVESKIHCLSNHCINNIQEACNLKGVAIDENGTCAGLVKYKLKDKNGNKINATNSNSPI